MKNHFMMTRKQAELLFSFLLFILVCIPLFQYLGFLTIRNWDESRNIINVYEMFHNGNWLVPHYHGNPDMWNTKPPLLFWFQVISMKIFGINEWAFRLPSAIAALFTCVVLYCFLRRYLNNLYIAIFSVLVLITSTGYVRVHVTRSGDFDALLILFTTISAISFFFALNHKKTKYIYIFYVALTLAILTKGIAGLLFLPAFFLFALFTKNLQYIFTNKHFYFGVLIPLVFGLGYYPLREVYNPGYLDAVLSNELGGRYQGGLDGNDKRPFEFYLKNIFEKDFKNYVYLLVGGIFIGLISKNEKIRKIVLFSSLIVLSYLLIVSTSKTKLSWYDAPIYPFMATIVGCFVFILIRLLQSVFNEKILNSTKLFSPKTFHPLIYAFVILFSFLAPYLSIYKKTRTNEEPEWTRHEYKLTYFLRDVLEEKYDVKDVDGTFIVLSEDGGIKQPLEFYQLLLQEKGINISIKEKEKLIPGDVVFAYQDDAKAYLKEHYDYKIYTEYKNDVNYMFVKKYEILKKKETP